MNRCSVCHERLPGLSQGMCSECKDWSTTMSPSSGWHQTALQNRQQLHQQRLNRLSSFPSGQSNPPTSQESSNGED